MNTVTPRKLFVILTASTAVCLPAPSQAATAVLPWDRTLTAVQDMLIDTVAPAAIALAFSGAVILYALAGPNKQAGRLVACNVKLVASRAGRKIVTVTNSLGLESLTMSRCRYQYHRYRPLVLISLRIATCERARVIR